MTQPVRFVHANKNPRLRYTAAYSFSKEGNTLTIQYGIAQCSKADTFSREAGRDLSALRMFRAPALTKRQSIYYGTLTIADADGLSVGKEVQKHFEAQRKAALLAVQSK